MPTTTPLQIKNLAHSYGSLTIFSQVNLTLGQGECVVLLGKSGCGKSTLLRDIAGLTTPKEGQIQIDKQVVFDKDSRYSLPTEKRQVGMLFQDYALFPTMTVQQNIAFGLHNQPNTNTRVRELLRLTELEALENRYPHQLSGGQQQRTALARALAPKPKLLLLDEPFANIDARLRAQLGNAIRRAIEYEKIAAIMVTHDRNDAFSLADRIAVIGRMNEKTTIIQEALPTEIYLQPVSPQVASLTGEVIELKGQAQGSTAKTPIGDFSLAKPLQGPVKLLIRPEQLELKLFDKGRLTVKRCQFFGDRFRILASFQNQFVQCYWDAPLSVGQCFNVENKVPIWAITSPETD